MGKQTTLTVIVSHDVEQGIWYIHSSDIPGLNAEAATLDELVGIISDVSPDLVAANLPEVPADSPISIQHTLNTKPARAA